MKRLLLLLTAAIFLLPARSEGTEERLASLFKKAERCYLRDDYQQLEAYIKKFADIYIENSDSLDATAQSTCLAYYYKMCGAFYYGLAEDKAFSKRSELSYRRSLGFLTENVGNWTVSSMTPAMATLHQELAQLYYKTRQYDLAAAQLDTLMRHYDTQYHDLGIDEQRPNYYQALTQQAMVNARLGHFDLALSQIDQALADYYKKKKDAGYYETLRRKGKILMLQADSLGTSHMKKAADCYRQYLQERYATLAPEMNALADDEQRHQHWLATHQFLYDCFRLGNQAPEMLYDLTLFSKDYLVRRTAARTTWQQVRRSLRKDECAIEFVQYFGRHDQRRMGCLVLHPGSKKPLFVDLYATDSLLRIPLLQDESSGSLILGDAITSTYSEDKDSLYLCPTLPSQVWTPQLMQAIGSARRIYFAPDGPLHQLAIEYFLPDSTLEARRLSSTRVLVQGRRAPRLQSALICGGITYDAMFAPSDRHNDVVAYRFLSSSTATINDLPGARIEVDSIYATRHHPEDTLLVGRLATDEAVVRLMQRSYDIIHLSTHGYFGGRIGIGGDIKPLLGDDSMSQSGLLFAGSANTLTDQDFDDDLFDGVLSAAELSHQDLSHTELVVLSACQTALGRLTDDGVCGIQRGLKQAGAQSMVITLWSVSDESSCRLMRFFYEELERQQEKDIHAAFSLARQRLMQEEKTYIIFDSETLSIKPYTVKFNTPSHTCPFIIVDAL